MRGNNVSFAWEDLQRSAYTPTARRCARGPKGAVLTGPIDDAASKAVGASEPDAFRLRPRDDAAALPPAAGALARAILSPALGPFVEDFHQADERALFAKRRHNTMARLAIYANSFAIYFGAAFLAVAPYVADAVRVAAGAPLESILLWAAGFLLILGGILEFNSLRGSSFDTWMRSRGWAEIARIEFFRRLIGEVDEPARDGEIALLPLKLEYFRKRFLDMQAATYRARGAAHRKLLGGGALLGYGAALVAGVVVAWSLFAWSIDTGALVDFDMRSYLAALAIVGAGAVIGAQARFRHLRYDQRNATRYLTTADNLDFLRDAYLAKARRAAAEGDTAAALAFAEAVMEQVSSEHREWVSLTGRAPTGVHKAARDALERW